MKVRSDPETPPFTIPEIPDFGALATIAEGLIWTRIPLPYRLDHVNVYLLKDGASWALLDTGIYTPKAIATWKALFAGPLAGIAIRRVIVTHHHPDHIGLAGWFCREFGAELLTSRSAYLAKRGMARISGEGGTCGNFDFYVRHGMSKDQARNVATHGSRYLDYVTDLPPTFQRLLAGDKLVVGRREFQVLTGDGHAPEQVMLYCAAENLFVSADQILEKITPNVSVYANEPDGDPLGHFLRSLRMLRQSIPSDALVLPGHHRPFFDLHRRSCEIEAHHYARCQLIVDACNREPHSVADLVPILFSRALDAHQMSFAFAETLAHINRLVRRGELEARDEDGRTKFVSVPGRLGSNEWVRK